MPYKVRTTVTRKNKSSPYVKKTIVTKTPFRRSKVSRRPKMEIFENGIGMMYEKTFNSKREAKRHFAKYQFRVDGYVNRDKDGYVFADEDYIW